nr:EspA/EspE family type VII secretion system effector [Mycolicibacterium sphagni]
MAGIHDLAYVFTRVGASVDAGARQDWVALGANLAGGAGKLVWYAKGQGAFKALLEKVGKKALPTPTAIIDVTQVAVVLVDLLNGFGAPNAGGGFTSGIDKLKNVDSKLELAIPDSRDWSGAAADAYMAQNAALQALVREMQALDKEIQQIVKGQGDEIFQAHRTLSILGFALVAAQGIALGLYFIPLVGPEVSLLFQVVACLAAVTTVVVTETLALARSMNAANAAELVTAKYIALGKKADLGGDFSTIKVSGADETKVSSFKAISDGLSAYSVSAPPSVSSLAAAAGDTTTEQRLSLLTALSPEESSLDAASMTATDTPETPDAPTTPVSPTYAPPTMAQVTQFSTQVGKISSGLAQPLNVVNQTMGSVQQIVSSAQQGAGAPAAAAADATMVDHEEPTEAEGAGGAEGERAPVDASGAEREQASAERIL